MPADEIISRCPRVPVFLRVFSRRARPFPGGEQPGRNARRRVLAERDNMKLNTNFGNTGEILKAGKDGAAWVASWGATDAARAHLEQAIKAEDQRRRELAGVINRFDERIGRSFKDFDAAVRAAMDRADAARAAADSVDPCLPAVFDPVERQPVERFKAAVAEFWDAVCAFEVAEREVDAARAGVRDAEQERERLREVFRDSLGRGYEAAQNALGGVAEIAKVAADEADALARQRAYLANLPDRGAEA